MCDALECIFKCITHPNLSSLDHLVDVLFFLSLLAVVYTSSFAPIFGYVNFAIISAGIRKNRFTFRRKHSNGKSDSSPMDGRFGGKAMITHIIYMLHTFSWFSLRLHYVIGTWQLIDTSTSYSYTHTHTNTIWIINNAITTCDLFG